jgi:hypothetical protein
MNMNHHSGTCLNEGLAQNMMIIFMRIPRRQ